MSNLPQKPKVLAILGPTASGKSALAVELARKFNGEIISADSRQVYRGLDIGSGKITKSQMRSVPHHLLDVASPKSAAFSAGRYQQLSGKALSGILGRGKLPIIAGGTGLYIDALLYNFSFPEVKANPKLRKQLELKTTEVLFKELQKRDPQRAGAIDRHNRRRLIRALEIVLTTKAPVPQLAKESPYEILKIGIVASKEQLEKKIVGRLEKRLKQGLVKEVDQLHASGVSWKTLDAFGLEYRFTSRYLRKLISKEEMKSAIVRESLQYAKRQMTWWRRDKEIVWIEDPGEAAPLVSDFLKK